MAELEQVFRDVLDPTTEIGKEFLKHGRIWEEKTRPLLEAMAASERLTADDMRTIVY